MSRWPPAELRERARAIRLECPDCPGYGTVAWSQARARWVADLHHSASCPVRRHARSRRAAERDLADVLAVALHLAHYAADGELITVRHRVAA